METWIPNSDPEIIKLNSLYSTQKQYWLTKLGKITGLYNVVEGYVVYIADNIAAEITTPLTTNRYLFNSKVTFQIPVLYAKVTMNPSGIKNAQYGIHITPKITSIVFVENRATKQFHFKLEIKNTYDLFNPSAGSSEQDYKFDVKGFKTPTITLNSIETKEYYYQTFTFNTKEISFNRTVPTDPITPISQDPVNADSSNHFDISTSQLNSFSPLSMGDDAVVKFPSNQSRLTKFLNIFKRKDKDGNMK